MPRRAAASATHIIPRYLPTVCDQLATEPELTISESMTLDTRIEANCTGGVIMQINGPPICVVHYGTITIATNKTLTVTSGSIGRAIALVADHALTIDGILDMSANGPVSGPGGGIISPNTDVGAIWPAAQGGAGIKDPGRCRRYGDRGRRRCKRWLCVQMDPAERVSLVGGARGATTFFSNKEEAAALPRLSHAVRKCQ